MAVDLSTATPLGTDPTNSTPLYQAEWGYLIGESAGDGVLGDLTGDGWMVFADGSSTNVVVKPDGASLTVRGTLGRHGTDITLDVAAVGVAPTSGQTRRDLIVARRDATNRKVQLDVLAGTPATSGAVDPTVTRNPIGVWEIPLARVTRVGNTAVTQAMVERLVPWSARALGQVVDLALAADAPMGTLATVGGELWERAPAGRGTDGHATGIAWWCRTDPPFTSTGWAFASGIKADGAENYPRFRRVGGRIEASGQVIRTTGAEFASGANTYLGTVPASVASALSDTRFGQTATNTAYGCRLQLAPQAGGNAFLYALCPPGTTAITLDGWSVPIA